VAEQMDSVTGAVIEGTDGSVYFIPEVILAKYKVDDASAAVAKEAFSADEVSGFDFSNPLLGKEANQILRGQFGPFGSVPSGTTFAGDNDKTVIISASDTLSWRKGPGPVIG